MITEHQQEQATLFALGELTLDEERDFTAQVRATPELREFLRTLQDALDRVVLDVASFAPPAGLRQKVLDRIRSRGGATPEARATHLRALTPELRFLAGSDTGWKPLPVPGAFVKLLSLQADRGYAVLMGRLNPGARYPAHTNVGPEDFYILTGDLHVGTNVLGPGDFHHADAGSLHGENYSVEGCTLIAVLTTDDPLVQLAMT